jgi:hypothetical protein
LFQAPAPAPASDAGYNVTNINLGIGAILPGGMAWRPLTPAERRKIYFKDSFVNLRSIGGTVFWAGMDLAKDEPREWRQGVAGYGMRYASRYGRSLTGKAIFHSGAALMGTDVRYFASGSPNPFRRMGNAVYWQFMTRHRSGRHVPDLPGIAAAYLQEIIGTTWVPNQTVTGYALKTANQQLIQGVVSNLIREFLPEMKRVVRWKTKPAPAVPPPPALPPPPPAGPPTQSSPPASGAVPRL